MTRARRTTLGLGLILVLLALLLRDGPDRPDEATEEAPRSSRPEGAAPPTEPSPRSSCPLGLRVVDASDGRPVGGARVRVFADAALTMPISDLHTDAAGHADVPGLAAKKGVYVRYEAPGYRFEVEKCRVDPEDPDRWRLDLYRPVRVDGLVRDARTEAPIANARVTTSDGPPYYSSGTSRVARGVPRDGTGTGPDGRFELADAGSVLRVEAEGYATVHKLRWGAAKDLVIGLVPTGQLAGRVTDEDDRPVPGVRVVAAPASFPWPHAIEDPRALHRMGSLESLRDGTIHQLTAFEWTTTDEEGRYRLAFSTAEAAKVVVLADGRLNSKAVVARVSAEPTTLDLRLGPVKPPPPKPRKKPDPGADVRIAGRVVDDRGAPVVGARVRDRPPRKSSTVTGPDGTYELWIRPGEWMAVRAEAEGHFRSGTVEVFPQDRNSVEIRLERHVIVWLPISVEAGETPPKVVRLEGSFTNTRWSHPRWPSDGMLELVLRAETKHILVKAFGFVPVDIPVELSPGETRRLSEVRLVRGAALDVRVVDGEGRDLPGVRVSASHPNGHGQGGITDKEGRVRITGLVSGGRYVVTAEKEHHVRIREGVDAPATLGFRLIEHATIHGTVVDEDGLPVSSARVSARRIPPAPSSDGFALADNAGRFHMRVPPGRYRVEIKIPGERGEPIVHPEVTARRVDDPPRRIQVAR